MLDAAYILIYDLDKTLNKKIAITTMLDSEIIFQITVSSTTTTKKIINCRTSFSRRFEERKT